MRINIPLFYRDGIVLVQYFNYAKWSPELTWLIIVVWALHVLKVGLHFFFFQTLLNWSTFFHKAKIPQQKSCPEVEYCCVLNWPDLLRHFFFFANAQMHRVPHALFMQQVITTLNKRIFSIHSSRLATVYIHAKVLKPMWSYLHLYMEYT